MQFHLLLFIFSQTLWDSPQCFTSANCYRVSKLAWRIPEWPTLSMANSKPTWFNCFV